jgi:protein-tyrosine phosphatase
VPGTNGYHVGQQPHRFSQKVAKKWGIDISSQQCRTFTKNDFEKFDKIYAMSNDILDEIKLLSKDKYRSF